MSPPNRWKRANVLSRAALVAILAGPWAGCGDVEFNWQETGQTARSARPGPDSKRPGPRADQAPSSAPAVRQARAPNRPVDREVPFSAAPQPGDYFQLVLFSEPPPPETPPNFLHVRLERAAADSVGDVLSRLYVPVGIQGRTRCLLIYGTQAEWRAAAEFVRVFDVAPLDDLPQAMPPQPVEAFQRAIAVMMARSRTGAVDRSALAKVATVFEQTAANEQATPILRWAGAMLAGDLCARTLYDFNRAEQLYVAAAGIAPGGSIEQMNALYARARTDVANGRKDRADPLFATVIQQFAAYRHSEVYLRCRRGLGMVKE
jgi:hypothetical protein